MHAQGCLVENRLLHSLFRRPLRRHEATAKRVERSDDFHLWHNFFGIDQAGPISKDGVNAWPAFGIPGRALRPGSDKGDEFAGECLHGEFRIRFDCHAKHRLIGILAAVLSAEHRHAIGSS